MVEARMYVESIKESASGAGRALDGRIVELRAVYGDSEENKTWSKRTPAGTVMLQITNPDAFHQFKPGQLVRVTLEGLDK